MLLHVCNYYNHLNIVFSMTPVSFRIKIAQCKLNGRTSTRLQIIQDRTKESGKRQREGGTYMYEEEGRERGRWEGKGKGG